MIADLIEIQAEALFTCDADGRLRHLREPVAEAELVPAPRFFMGRTRQRNIWRVRHDLPDALIDELEKLCQAEPLTADLAAPPHNAEAIRAVLHQYAPVNKEWRGPAYHFPADLQASADVVLVSDANVDCLDVHFSWAIESGFGLKTGPVAVKLVGGEAVSICFCARLTARAAEAGVETEAHFRGRGYAGGVVSAWAQAMRQRGVQPLYSTAWDNLASQRVAQKLGLICYGDDWSVY